MTLLDQIVGVPTSAEVEAYAVEFRNWISANIPTIDVNDPVVNAVIIGPWVNRIATMANRVDAISQLTALSASTIGSLASGVSEADISAFLCELHGVDNASESYAIGEVKIVFKTENPSRYLVNIGTVFTSPGGVEFTTNVGYVFASQSTNNTIQLRKNKDGGYYGIVPVIAVVPGSSGNIGADTSLTVSGSFPVDVECTTVDTFQNGKDGLSVAEILAKIKYRYASSVLNTREQIVLYLSKLQSLGNVSQIGVVGVGDSEMLRCDHPFLPVQKSGAADIYVACSNYPATKRVVVQAVVASSAAGQTKLTIPISEDDAPGYLKILSIRDVSSDLAISIDSETRDLNIEPKLGTLMPLITDPRHAAFSAFQTAVVVGNLPQTADVGSTRNVELTVLQQPGIAEAQSTISGRLVRSLGGDVLVRSAIPMLLSIEVTLTAQYELEVPNADLMKQAIVKEIGDRPMRASIFAADIIRAISRYLSDDIVPSSVSFSAEVIMTDGSSSVIHEVGKLDTPDNKAMQLTPRTAAFYTNTSMISFLLSRILAPSTP